MLKGAWLQKIVETYRDDREQNIIVIPQNKTTNIRTIVSLRKV